MVGEYDSNNLKNQFTFKVTFNNMFVELMKELKADPLVSMDIKKEIDVFDWE